MLLATPPSRAWWVVASGAGVHLAIALATLVTAAGIALGTASVGGDVATPGVGTLALGLYGIGLAGAGIAVAGVFGTAAAGTVVAALAIGTFLVDMLAPPLDLPASVRQLALTYHMGQPMVGKWMEWGLVASARSRGRHRARAGRSRHRRAGDAASRRPALTVPAATYTSPEVNRSVVASSVRRGDGQWFEWAARSAGIPARGGTSTLFGTHGMVREHYGTAAGFPTMGRRGSSMCTAKSVTTPSRGRAQRPVTQWAGRSTTPYSQRRPMPAAKAYPRCDGADRRGRASDKLLYAEQGADDGRRTRSALHSQ